MRLLAIAALAGCYSAPSSNASCSLLCSDACPDDLACVNGFCVADGERCEPAFEHVSAGNGFVCALDSNRRRWCWGANDQHQLDSSSRVTLAYATLVDNGPWDAITTGGDHTCGLRDGAVYCWGGNDRQQISGTISGDVEQPLRVTAPNRAAWTAIVAGYATTCGVAGGKLFCWGANNSGQVGMAGGADVGAPSQVGELDDWITVAVGRDHACGVSLSAGLLCWGANTFGQLGDGGTIGISPQKLPTPVALPGVTAIAVAGSSTCAVANGQLFCWGRSTGTSLAEAIVDPCVGATSTPVLANTVDGWTQLTASRDQLCGLRAGELWCWGTTTSGLGNGVWGSSKLTAVTTGVSEVSVGWNTNLDDTGVESGDLDVTCFIVDGAIQCWGDNRYGQLAQGAASMAPEPVEIAGDHVWSTLVTGDSHMCGIDDQGVPMCWGTNLLGQINGVRTGDGSVPCDRNVLCATGVPTALPLAAHADAIAVGDDHTCVLDAGQLTCWGNNAHGQLGAAGVTSPNVVPGNWSSLYAFGGKAVCAVQNGQTFCWGSITSFRQPVTHDVRFDGMKSIGISAFIGDTTVAGNQRTHGCMLAANGLLSCFGVDTHGQFGRGPPAQSCGNGVCDLDERETTCGDCVGKRTCTTNSCGVQTCNPVCGDGQCNVGYGETCSTCAADCGACPYVALGRSYEAMSVNWDSTTGFTCGIRADLRIECWGRNTSGQAGVLDGSTGRVIDPVFTPSVIPELASCSAISAGGSSACAICGGDIYCWGNHRTGAVGAGPPTAYPITNPRKLDIDLEDADQWAQLVSGQGFSCARSERGRGFCWGFHARGALGTGGVSLNLPAAIRTAP
jgi:alpha-tubulin suppressor-like RCC1 family protein